MIKKIFRKAKKLVANCCTYVKTAQLSKKNISIISNNCIAGFLYKEFGLKYLSPTINLQIAPADFVKFCTNLKFYLHQEISQIENPDVNGFKALGGSTIDFPVSKFTGGGGVIYFQHYTSFQQAYQKWHERKVRVNFDNLYFILVDTNCDEQTVKEFLQLPYEKKLFLTSNKNFLFDEKCFLLDIEMGKAWFDTDEKTGKPYYAKFDFYKWFSE